MRRDHVRDLLRQVADGSLDVSKAVDALSFEPAESLGFATIDHHRALRQGFPEVIYGAGKTAEQVRDIAMRISSRGEAVLATRVAPDAAELLRASIPNIELNALGRTAYVAGSEPPSQGTGTVTIVTAGTSEGIHRVLAKRDELLAAAVVIVIAGMDGALPSVVGGLVKAPVIAVPTSVGYGAAFQGIAPLLTMLNSCAAGITVVNIDNGFGAAVAASRITHS
jgi:NCAIR mutase (PurE)-related protein